ncbi:N-(5'-phosphoribosyl)anthranilate isomerase [Planctomycetales bacterium]|nr:N-(5'-phosphoribosyl)anthranilate isomerase [Planctomycetales bacterium]
MTLLKVCGITTPEDAAAVLETGADFIGAVHYPKSPRHLTAEQIKPLLAAVKPFHQKRGQNSVLVIADSAIEDIVKLLDEVETEHFFNCVQIHREITDTELYRIKTLIKQRTKFHTGIIRVIRSMSEAERLLNEKDIIANPLYYLLELSHGNLPGGNGKEWDWSLAKEFCRKFPTLLAGGITPDNVLEVIRQAEPLGVDLSSGVESSPGKKDIEKVREIVIKLTSHNNPSPQSQGI